MSAETAVLIVVVLYQEDDAGAEFSSRSLETLAAAFDGEPWMHERFRVLAWDNSPRGARPVPSWMKMVRTERNDGVAGAYNGAMKICIKDGYKWMVLLDQDTEVNPQYLAGMAKYAEGLIGEMRVGAVAPLLVEGEFPLSPHRVKRYRRQAIVSGAVGVLEEEAFAANSGVMLRVAALEKIGGYSLDFWLDYSDIDMFHRLYRAGWRLFLASDLRLEHSMTMLDYDNRMTPGRFENFLYAEQAFSDLYQAWDQKVLQSLRLLARVVRQRRYRDRTYSRMSWAFFLRGLTTGKRRRMAEWEARKVARHAGRV